MNPAFRWLVRVGYRGGLVLLAASLLDHFGVHDRLTMFALGLAGLCAPLMSLADVIAEMESRHDG